MGFKDDVRAKADEFGNDIALLKDRVTALENIACRLNATSALAGNRVTTGVDYGAVAFGLSEIKRKVAQINGVHGLGEEYEGAVQYFADVFAKADPSFNAAEFKRQAGV